MQPKHHQLHAYICAFSTGKTVLAKQRRKERIANMSEASQTQLKYNIKDRINELTDQPLVDKFLLCYFIISNIKNNIIWIMMYRTPLPPILPPCRREIRLGGFGLWNILRPENFGVVFDLEFQTRKYSCRYVFLKEYLSSLKSFYFLSYLEISQVQ